MIKIIKSYIAHWNWMRAHSFMGNISPDLALVAIRRAVKYEPDEKNLPKYMELQGHIESQLGRKEMALQTFLSARSILGKHPTHFKVGETKDIRDRIFTSIDEIQNEGT